MFKYFLDGLITVGKSIINIFKYFIVGLFNILTIVPRFIALIFIFIFDKKERNKIIKKKKKPFVPAILLLFSLSIYFMCVYTFFRWSVQTMKINNLNNDIINFSDVVEEEDRNATETLPPSVDTDNNNNNDNNYVPNNNTNYSNTSYLSVNFDELKRQNSDTVGWIKVEGTKVNYSVVQAGNNDYYLEHDFYKNKSSAGWIFADWRSDMTNFKRNTIIYGHNMNNKTMFGSIPSTLRSAYWQNNSNNHYVKLSTPTANTVWKIFSIYVTEPKVDYLRTIFTDEEYKNFIKTIQGKSEFNFNTDVSIDDYIITLSTCDDSGKKRMVTHAKLVKYQPR